MAYILLGVACFLLQNLSNKEFSRRFSSRLPGLALLNALALTVAVVSLLLLGGAQPLTGGALFMAVGYGLLFVATIFGIVASMSSGPLGPTALIVNASMVLSVILGVALWGETMTLKKGLGALGMIGALTLSGLSTRGGRSASVRWFVLALLSFLGNGLLSVMQKSLSWSFPEVSVTSFTFWAMAFGAVACWLLVLLFRVRGERFREWLNMPKPLALCAAGVGLGTVGGNAFTMTGLALVPAIVAFPLSQGLVILLLNASSMVIYRERMTLSGAVSMVLGILGIVLLV